MSGGGTRTFFFLQYYLCYVCGGLRRKGWSPPYGLGRRVTRSCFYHWKKYPTLIPTSLSSKSRFVVKIAGAVLKGLRPPHFFFQGIGLPQRAVLPGCAFETQITLFPPPQGLLLGRRRAYFGTNASARIMRFLFVYFLLPLW